MKTEQDLADALAVIEKRVFSSDLTDLKARVFIR
jgi:hypothetical protein